MTGAYRGHRVCFGSVRVKCKKYICTILDCPSLLSYGSLVVHPTNKPKVACTLNRFLVLKIATFHPILYIYMSTTPNAPCCSKSTATCHKPTLKQVSILRKIQCMKQSDIVPSTNQLAVLVAAANNYKGYKSRIQGIFQNQDVWLVAMVTNW